VREPKTWISGWRQAVVTWAVGILGLALGGCGSSLDGGAERTLTVLDLTANQRFVLRFANAYRCDAGAVLESRRSGAALSIPPRGLEDGDDTLVALELDHPGLSHVWEDERELRAYLLFPEGGTGRESAWVLAELDFGFGAQNALTFRTAQVAWSESVEEEGRLGVIDEVALEFPEAGKFVVTGGLRLHTRYAAYRYYRLFARSSPAELSERSSWPEIVGLFRDSRAPWEYRMRAQETIGAHGPVGVIEVLCTPLEGVPDNEIYQRAESLCGAWRRTGSKEVARVVLEVAETGSYEDCRLVSNVLWAERSGLRVSFLRALLGREDRRMTMLACHVVREGPWSAQEKLELRTALAQVDGAGDAEVENTLAAARAALED
jgi:hypothetical protein